jgi:phosphoglycolate phosphatase
MSPATVRNRTPILNFLDLYDLFVFDLDGTLADTREDLTASVNHALGILGLPVLDPASVMRLVGDGARVLIERALGPASTPERLELGLAAFLADYAQTCTARTRLYPGVERGLAGLHERGKRLAVLTNKPLLHSRRILAALGIEDRFARVEAGDTAPRKPAPAGLLAIASGLGIDPGRTILVGDTSIDVRTARAAGARSVWVSYGFVKERPLEPPPDYVLDSIEDLLAGGG